MAAVWLWHTAAAALGMRRVPDISQPEWDPKDAAPDGAREWPRVSIIVPARDEEEMIGAAIESMLDLKYPNYEVIAVDDRSEDRTGAILDEMAAKADGRLKVVHVRELPAGWLGKTHAMHLASQAATGKWLLFTDADVMHRKDSLLREVNYGERAGADHLIVLPTMVMESWGERAMTALFQAVFIFAHQPWKVNDPKSKEHIGVGAFNMVRRTVYDKIGGHERLRLSVVDDMRLGANVKDAGFSQQCVFARDYVRVRWAHGLFGVVNNTAKNFFAEFGFRTWLALAAAVAVSILQLGPWVGAIFEHGWARLGYVIALLCVLLVYYGMKSRSGVSVGYVLLHPLAAVLLVYALLQSMTLTLWRGGVVWRGTKYSLKELRAATRGHSGG